MVFRRSRNLIARFGLIVALIAGIYGMLPMQARAEQTRALDFEGQECDPDSGWMWATGPFAPEIAAQVQNELAGQGIEALVEARSYGETDGCGTYYPHGIDFTVQLRAQASRQPSSPPGLADRIVPILKKHGKPDLGNVKLFSPQGELIPVDTQDDFSTAQAMAASVPVTDLITKNVYVIVYDPLLSDGQKLSQRMNWNDHTKITQLTIDSFKRSTNNRLNYAVVETDIVTSGWPRLIDGFSYTEQEYLAVLSGQQPMHRPWEVDYNWLVNLPEFDICGKANRGEIDEVWVYNAPYFGFWESRLVGPGAYAYNSPPIINNNGCTRLIPIMGPSVERTEHEAVHNFGHRAEATMEKVYAGWAQNRTNHRWDQFGLSKLFSPDYSYSGCGNIHWPPNAVEAEYDYSNPAGTQSNCNDFYNHPNLGDPLAVSQPVTCSEWSCNGLGYYEYWFNHFPAFQGCGADNISNDWWIYFAHPANAINPSAFCPSNLHKISGNAGAPGVVMSYIDSIAKSTMTDEAGNYSLVVSPNWSGTITPSKVGHTFSPAGKSYSNVTGNLAGQDYTTQGGTPPSHYYVDIARGNNANACTSPAAPCRNIQEAVSKASSGDVIYIATGRYLFSSNVSPNVVIINKSLTLSGGWNSFFSAQVGASTIDGANINNGILITSGAVVVENFIVENSVSQNSGAIYIVSGYLTLKKSTLRNNMATNNGAGIFVDKGTVNIINSTISGNWASGAGGGIYASLNGATSITIQNSTIAYNQASRGGGISQANAAFNITNTILANNIATSNPDCDGVLAIANSNLIEDMTGCTISTGSGNLNEDPQIASSLTGSMLVHMPLAGSPVINAGTNAGCPTTDQQGTDRPQDGVCDIGSVEYLSGLNTPTFTPTFTPTLTATPPSVNKALYLSLTGSQTIGGVASRDEDILKFDEQDWSLFFDGSDVGVGSPDLFAFSIVDADTILMAFSAGVTVQGIAATPQDVLRFDATSLGSTTSGTWSMYFDGSDVGLETTSEKIDSVTLLPDGQLLISTTGNPAVPGLSGLADEDILAFTPTSLGANTSGTWAQYFDGSDVGLSTSSGEDVDALDITSNGDIYLSTLDNFSVSGVSGADEDVFVCTPISLGSNTACTFSASLYFDGSSWGLSSNDVDAIHVLTTSSTPWSTPTATFTPTATHTATATGTSVVPPTATHTPTPTLSNPPTATGTPIAIDVIFADGFESGDLSAWSSSSTDSGDLSVSSAAAMVGSQGMQAVIDDNNVLSVISDHPNSEAHYHARFHFDPNSIGMASGNSHIIVRGYGGSSTVALRVEFGYGASGYQLRTGLINDGSTWTETSWFPISDEPHSIELDWRAASGAGTNNGGLVLWIDGVQKQTLTGIDNDTRRMQRVLLGALASIDSGTRGTYYFDAFESQR